MLFAPIGYTSSINEEENPFSAYEDGFGPTIKGLQLGMYFTMDELIDIGTSIALNKQNFSLTFHNVVFPTIADKDSRYYVNDRLLPATIKLVLQFRNNELVLQRVEVEDRHENNRGRADNFQFSINKGYVYDVVRELSLDDVLHLVTGRGYSSLDFYDGSNLMTASIRISLDEGRRINYLSFKNAIFNAQNMDIEELAKAYYDAYNLCDLSYYVYTSGRRQGQISHFAGEDNTAGYSVTIYEGDVGISLVPAKLTSGTSFD